jgi:trigger factor
LCKYFYLHWSGFRRSRFSVFGFPSQALRDKTLAGKKALFDVSVLEASKRRLPEVTDEFANEVRAGLTAETLKAELQKAVDSEDAKEYAPARNAALAKALAEVMDVEVPDTLVTNQAREKFALMMADMRNGGVSDEEIKKQISPENFLKYKKIVKDDIVKDFKVSMATDEIARLEGIDVPDYQVEEQMESIKQEAAESQEEFDEQAIRSRVEATLQRQAVMDFLAENAELEVEFVDGKEDFDEALMQKLANESLAREEELTAKAASEKDETGESAPETPPEVAEAAAKTVIAEISTGDAPEKRDMDNMSLEDKAYYALLDAGALKSDS